MVVLGHSGERLHGKGYSSSGEEFWWKRKPEPVIGDVLVQTVELRRRRGREGERGLRCIDDIVGWGRGQGVGVKMEDIWWRTWTRMLRRAKHEAERE